MLTSLLAINLAAWQTGKETYLPASENSRYRLPMIILFANTKGGVGKSTLAAHLTIFLHDLGEKVALLDSDSQASSSIWVSEVEPCIQAVKETNPDLAVEQLLALKQVSNFVICDSPGGLNETSRTLMLLADLVVFPVGPSIVDLRSLVETTKTLMTAQRINAGRPAGLIVCSRIKRRSRISRELPAVAQQLGITVAQTKVRELEAFRDAAQQATVATRMPGTEAGKDAKALFEEILARLPVVAPTTSKRVANG